ncbi:hypothetical protein NUSPORA_02525 [Nucleospora cyclopteri]
MRGFFDTTKVKSVYNLTNKELCYESESKLNDLVYYNRFDFIINILRASSFAINANIINYAALSLLILAIILILKRNPRFVYSDKKLILIFILIFSTYFILNTLAMRLEESFGSLRINFVYQNELINVFRIFITCYVIFSVMSAQQGPACIIFIAHLFLLYATELLICRNEEGVIYIKIWSSRVETIHTIVAVLFFCYKIRIFRKILNGRCKFNNNLCFDKNDIFLISSFCFFISNCAFIYNYFLAYDISLETTIVFLYWIISNLIFVVSSFVFRKIQDPTLFHLVCFNFLLCSATFIGEDIISIGAMVVPDFSCFLLCISNLFFMMYSLISKSRKLTKFVFFMSLIQFIFRLIYYLHFLNDTIKEPLINNMN